MAEESIIPLEHEETGSIRKEDELDEWLRETGEQSEVDLSFVREILDNNKLKLHLLGEVTDIEWGEMVRQIGPRIVLRKAAIEVPLRGERVSLLSECSRLRGERDNIAGSIKEAQQTLAQLQQQLESAKTELSRSTMEERDSAVAACEEAEKKKAGIEAEIKNEIQARDAASAEKNAVKEELAKLQAEKALVVEEIRLLQSNRKAEPASAPVPVSTTPRPLAAPAAVAPAAPTPEALSSFERTPLPQLTIAQPQLSMSMPAPKPQSQMALMQGQAWFHANVSRLLCEAVLTHKSAQPGDFMVRASESEPGHYTLSVRLRSAPAGSLPIKHHRIREATGKFCITAGDLYNSIVELVAGYMSKGASSEIFLVRPAKLLPQQCAKCGVQCPPTALACIACSSPLLGLEGAAPGVTPTTPQGSIARTGSIYASAHKPPTTTLACRCGAILSPADKFCGECGAQTKGAATSSAVQPTVILCKGCRTVIPKDSRFCEKCGIAVNSS